MPNGDDGNNKLAVMILIDDAMIASANAISVIYFFLSREKIFLSTEYLMY